MRVAFLAAVAMPFLRSKTMACSTSPLDSVSACLQSIMGAPLRSRSFFTCAADTFFPSLSPGAAVVPLIVPSVFIDLLPLDKTLPAKGLAPLGGFSVDIYRQVVPEIPSVALVSGHVQFRDVHRCFCRRGRLAYFAAKHLFHVELFFLNQISGRGHSCDGSLGGGFCSGGGSSFSLSGLSGNSAGNFSGLLVSANLNALSNGIGNLGSK